MVFRAFLAAGWLTVSAMAGPSLSTVQDVLYKADGTRFSGTLTISWESFQPSTDTEVVPQGSTLVKVLDGYLRVQLVPNTNASPASTYTVLYVSDGKTQFRELWAVPPSTTPLHVHDVRVGASTVGGGSSAADTSGSSGPVAESGVTGLLSDLAARPVKGPAFAAGRVALIDGSGMMASVSGNAGDCVHVDGSTGACGSTSPSFVDGDTLSGIVDGSNTSFGLAAAPSPAASLAIYRNGVLLKASQDFTLSGTTVQFVAAAAPQPGDTLLASYRTDSGGGASTAPAVTNPQVLCSGSGSGTSSAMPGAIGSCTIPAGLLVAGDRVQIRFDLSHQGTAGGFSVELDWGTTAVVHRDVASNESLVSGGADATILGSGAQTSSQTWGTVLPFGATAGSARDDWGGGVTVTLTGSVTQAADSLTLNNFTVVRIP